VHETVEPLSTVTSHELPPAHVTVLPVPVAMLQVLVPAQLVVQLDPHELVHDDLPSHVVVQPVPQVEVHVLFEVQSYVAPFGGAASASTPPSAPAEPSTQVPPALQVHVSPLHEQAPTQAGAWSEAPALLPPHPCSTAIMPARATNVPRSNEALVRMDPLLLRGKTA
jgi:hypothetical protein